MPQKYGHMANEHRGNLVCCVCGDSPPVLSWTDQHGEAYCTKCGVIYQRIDGKFQCAVSEDFIPTIKEYFKETGKPCGAGTIIVWDDYPEIAKARKAFNAWLRKK